MPRKRSAFSFFEDCPSVNADRHAASHQADPLLRANKNRDVRKTQSLFCAIYQASSRYAHVSGYLPDNVNAIIQL